MTACITGKRVYASQVEANRALLICWKKGREEWKSYRCPHCDQFHLTSAGRRHQHEEEFGVEATN